jgi:hypothetical protein
MRERDEKCSLTFHRKVPRGVKQCNRQIARESTRGETGWVFKVEP